MRRAVILLFFMASAWSAFPQATLLAKLSAGVNKHYQTPNSVGKTDDPNFAFSGGILAEYGTNFGLALQSGVLYDFKHHKFGYKDYMQNSKSIKVPLSILIYTGSPSNGLIIGAALHRGLNKNSSFNGIEPSAKYQKSWRSYHLGYYYDIKKIRLSLILENDWTPYKKDTDILKKSDYRYANIKIGVSYKIYTF